MCLSGDRRSSVEALADEIIAMVEAAKVGGTHGDTSALAMYGAYIFRVPPLCCDSAARRPRRWPRGDDPDPVAPEPGRPRGIR